MIPSALIPGAPFSRLSPAVVHSGAPKDSHVHLRKPGSQPGGKVAPQARAVFSKVPLQNSEFCLFVCLRDGLKQLHQFTDRVNPVFAGHYCHTWSLVDVLIELSEY